VLVDLDGALIRGGRAVPGAAAFVAQHHSRLALVSNNSSDTPETLSLALARLGFAIGPQRMFLAGAVAIEEIAARHPGARLLLAGSAALKAMAVDEGLVLEERDPDAVLIARDESFDYTKLARAANAVRGGAKFYAANSDLFQRGPGDAVIPEAGALLLSVMGLAGRSPDRVFGKPHGPLLSRAMAFLGSRASEVVMIGDTPATDGLGADESGIGFIEVGERAGRTVADLVF